MISMRLRTDIGLGLGIGNVNANDLLDDMGYMGRYIMQSTQLQYGLPTLDCPEICDQMAGSFGLSSRERRAVFIQLVV